MREKALSAGSEANSAVNKEDNAAKAARSGIWYVVSNVMIRAVGIITAPVYTRLLTTAETGYANNFNNYVSIFYVIMGLCLIYSVGRAKLDYKGRDFDGYMSAIQGLSSIFGAVILIFVMIFMPGEACLALKGPSLSSFSPILSYSLP